MELKQDYITLIAKPILLISSVIFAAIFVFVFKHGWAFSALMGIVAFIFQSIHQYFSLNRTVKKAMSLNLEEPMVVWIDNGTFMKKVMYIVKEDNKYKQINSGDKSLNRDKVTEFTKAELDQIFSQSVYSKGLYDFIRVK